LVHLTTTSNENKRKERMNEHFMLLAHINPLRHIEKEKKKESN
jgi:hypothetical protein